MNIPSPPTDNLYKFISIFGLALVIAGFHFYVSLSDSIQKSYYDAAFSSNSKTPLYLNLVSIKDEKSPEFKEILNKVKELNDKEEKFLHEWKLAEKRMNRWKTGIQLMITNGIIMMVTGFSLWYFKLQRYQDDIIKKEAEPDIKL